MKRIERPQPCKIENRSEVDEEWIVALAGKHFDAPRQRMDCRGGKRIVIRRRPRPDVIGRSRQVRAKNVLPRRVSVRSEERRVGKEGRWGWRRWHGEGRRR